MFKRFLFISIVACAFQASAETPCGDVNGNGTVSSADSVIIKRALNGDANAQAALTRPDNCDVGGQVGCTLEDA